MSSEREVARHNLQKVRALFQAGEGSNELFFDPSVKHSRRSLYVLHVDNEIQKHATHPANGSEFAGDGESLSQSPSPSP